MPADETTSPDVATKAATVLRMTDAQLRGLAMREPGILREIAASALTQAPTKRKRASGSPKS